MKKPEVFLKQSIIFGSLAADEIDRLAPLFDRWPVQADDVLCSRGSETQFFFLLEKGTLLVAMDEGRAVVLSSPGDFVAMELASCKGRYISTVTALEAGGVWVIERQAFLDFIQADTEAAASVMAGWQSYLEENAPFIKQTI